MLLILHKCWKVSNKINPLLYNRINEALIICAQRCRFGALVNFGEIQRFLSLQGIDVPQSSYNLTLIVPDTSKSKNVHTVKIVLKYRRLQTETNIWNVILVMFQFSTMKSLHNDQSVTQ